MKSIFLTTLAALTLLTAPAARAWNYNKGDALLIFRNGGEDVEFDLGSVGQFLGQTNGYTTNVNNFNWSLVTSTFGSVSGVEVVLVANEPTQTTNWLSGAEPITTAYNIGTSAADSLYTLIEGVGVKPLFPTAIPTSGANGYAISTSGLYAPASYDYIVQGAGNGYIPKLGGNVPFVVQQSIPGSFDFWQVTPTTQSPAPPDHLVGTFTINTNGVLTFVAGPRPSTITGITRSKTNNVSTVSFTTTVGNTYSVAYTSQLEVGGTWPVDPNNLVGDGNTDTLTHTNSGGATEFYRIQTQ